MLREAREGNLFADAAGIDRGCGLESLLNPESAEGDTDWKIRFTVDKSAGTLTVSHNGIGMSYDETIEALGTIAHSGTEDFLMSLQSKD
jgi:molecular chaperone HtpG